MKLTKLLKENNALERYLYYDVPEKQLSKYVRERATEIYDSLMRIDALIDNVEYQLRFKDISLVSPGMKEAFKKDVINMLNKME